MPAGEEASEALHDGTIGGLRAASGESYRYHGEEDVADPHFDDEDEEARSSLSLRSRIAAALMAGGEWLERGSGSSPTHSRGGGRNKGSSLRGRRRGTASGNMSPALGRASPLSRSSSPVSTLRSGTTMEV